MLFMSDLLHFVLEYAADIGNGIEDKKPELYVECSLYIDGAPFGLPMRTRLIEYALHSIFHHFF